MSVRSPVAALTARLSLVLCRSCSCCRLLDTRPPKSTPGAAVAAAGAATWGTGSAPIAEMGGISTSLPESESGLVGVLRPLHDRQVRLVGPLGDDQLTHLLGEVDVGHAHVAVLVGQRVVRLVDEPALGAAELDPADLGATGVAVVLCLRHDVAGLERRATRRRDVIDVGDVVGHRIQPLAVDHEAGPGVVDRVEHAHQLLPIARRSWLNLAVMASTASE